VKPSEKDKRLIHLKHQERKALAKQERIKTWPEENRADGNKRVEANLSYIREEMKKLEKS
jgi:hypothetical protein